MNAYFLPQSSETIERYAANILLSGVGILILWPIMSHRLNLQEIVLWLIAGMLAMSTCKRLDCTDALKWLCEAASHHPPAAIVVVILVDVFFYIPALAQSYSYQQILYGHGLTLAVLALPILCLCYIAWMIRDIEMDGVS
jgi:hypothetical protein